MKWENFLDFLSKTEVIYKTSSYSKIKYTFDEFEKKILFLTIKSLNESWRNYNDDPILGLELFICEIFHRSKIHVNVLIFSYILIRRMKQLNKDNPSVSPFIDIKDDNMISNRRKMFLASIIVASKIFYDTSHLNNKTWSEIVNIDNVKYINSYEKNFLQSINYNLFISEDLFNLFLNEFNSDECNKYLNINKKYL